MDGRVRNFINAFKIRLLDYKLRKTSLRLNYNFAKFKVKL